MSVRLHDDGAAWQCPPCVYDPASWPLKVEELRTFMRQQGQSFCPITREPIPTEFATKTEHVVLQATGIRWISLPPGIVDDRVNNASSDCENELLHTGTLGFLLPMYVTGNRQATFTAGPGKSVTVANHHERGFGLQISNEEEIALSGPDEAGPGEFTIRANVPQPRPDLVSRALAKSAYLALCVHAPSLALREEFEPLCMWLNDRSAGGHRPYTEKLEVGVPPGATFRYLVDGTVDEQGRLLAVDWVIAYVRIHMVSYIVSLLDGHPDFSAFAECDNELTLFDKEERPAAERSTTFTFEFESAKRSK